LFVFSRTIVRVFVVGKGELRFVFFRLKRRTAVRVFFEAVDVRLVPTTKDGDGQITPLLHRLQGFLDGADGDAEPVRQRLLSRPCRPALSIYVPEQDDGETRRERWQVAVDGDALQAVEFVLGEVIGHRGLL
jgi:hypothetical protein